MSDSLKTMFSVVVFRAVLLMTIYQLTTLINVCLKYKDADIRSSRGVIKYRINC